jgi:hypothetical protein
MPRQPGPPSIDLSPIAGALQPDGGLYSLGWYLGWSVGDKTATLDGEFDPEELRAIADHMDRLNGAAG